MKYVLARALRTRICQLRDGEKAKAGQAFLFDPGAPVEATGAHAFEFRAGMYDGVRVYAGGYRFKKHFLGPDRVPDFDGKAGGEEERCAQVLDSLGEVRWWLRNIPRHGASFWLPTAHQRFYPDFVAELTDGRKFVLEYKGEQGWTDAELDRVAGRTWERAGGGLFLMVRERADGLEMVGQLTKKLRGG